MPQFDKIKDKQGRQSQLGESLSRIAPDKQVKWTVRLRHGRGASASFPRAFASRWFGRRGAAELRREVLEGPAHGS